MSIEIENISKQFGSFKALNDVGLTIPSGELVALLGPSGSGKTTLLQLIGCLDQPTSGHVYINGKDVSRLNRNQRADVRREIRFPDLPGCGTLKCDFHMHTVFSDGEVWPPVRVAEAWRHYHAGDFGAATVDLFEGIGKLIPPEHPGIRPEGICQDQIGAGLCICAVDRLHALRLIDVPPFTRLPEGQSRAL